MPSAKKESINKQLFMALKSRGYRPVARSKGDKKIGIPDADLFVFMFVKNGKTYGPARVGIDEKNNIILYTNEKLESSPQSRSKNSHFDDSWNGFKEYLSRWSRSHGMNGFKLIDDSNLESDMQLRQDMDKHNRLNEGYYPMGKKASYNDSIPSVKILLQHNRQIEEGEQRYRNIEKIFVENVNGERFLLPTRRPGVAKVYARHIAEGGTPYDERGKHITSLVEEYTKMAGFVRATKNGQFNESAQRLVNEGVNHYTNLRETLTRMISQRGYNKYFDSYSPVLNEESEDTTSLNELFVEETLDPRIESVLPILKKLSKNLNEMSEVKALEEWAESITEVEDETTKTLAEPAEEMLDEAPGAETLAHNQSTEKSNLKAFDLEEGFSPSEEVADMIEKSMGGAGKLTSDDIYRAVDEYQSMMDNPEELDTEEVAQILIDRLHSKGIMVPDISEDLMSAVGDLATVHAIQSTTKPMQKKTPQAKDSKAPTKKPSLLQKLDKWAFGEEEEVEEGLDANQKRAGQLGPTEKVGKNEKNLRGKLVGANESVENDELNRIKEMIGYK